ncbi:hypothetical protein ACVRWB_03290 [Streptococcus troglodytae]
MTKIVLNDIFKFDELLSSPIKSSEQEVYLSSLKAKLDKGYQDILDGNMIDAKEVFAEYDL